MSYARLEALGGIQWPCFHEDRLEPFYLHGWLWEDPLPRDPAPFSIVEHDPPVDEFPLLLTTGRRLDHITLVREEDGETVEMTLPSFVQRGDELDEIAQIVIRARQRWREVKGLAPKPVTAGASPGSKSIEQLGGGRSEKTGKTAVHHPDKLHKV